MNLTAVVIGLAVGALAAAAEMLPVVDALVSVGPGDPELAAPGIPHDAGRPGSGIGGLGHGCPQL